MTGTKCGTILSALIFLLYVACAGAQNRDEMADTTTTGDRNPAAPAALQKGEPQMVGMDAERLSAISDVMQNAIDDRQVSGGVVLVARRGWVVWEKAYGLRAIVPSNAEATVDTIYDMASLTKPVATASAVMKLVEQGKLRLNDSVSKLLPEWKNSPEDKKRLDEVNRIKRAIRLGAIRLTPDLLVAADIKTTPTPGAKPPKDSVPQLWRRMLREGRIQVSESLLDDLIAADAANREDVTLRHLLTHTSGIDSYVNYHLQYPERGARKKIIADIGQRRFKYAAGEKFIYSDLGYITLGEIVERAAGTDLNSFCKREIFEPLGMNDTMFNPPRGLIARIAPTEWRPQPTATAVPDKKTEKTDAAAKPPEAPKTMIQGEVHDGNAYVQDGISGHAGLFSTARDLSRYCQMLLNGGEYEDVRIFSPLTVRAMSEDKARLDSGTKRSYGWDVGSSYSGQRGDIFTTGFGHTGWTGTSVWIVPEEELFIIILTNRVHPDGTGDAGPLRSKVANVVAASIMETKDIPQYQDF